MRKLLWIFSENKGFFLLYTFLLYTLENRKGGQEKRTFCTLVKMIIVNSP